MHTHTADGHHHHHNHGNDKVINNAFIIGIVLNTIYVLVQFCTGIFTHSMAMLADAGHNLSDVASLALSLLAFKLAKKKRTNSFTYGYKKTTILAALVNAIVLLITIGIFGYESVNRLFHPQPINGGTVAYVAAVGIVINLLSALLFFKDKEHDINTKGAYLHLLTDALVSLGVVVAGIIISYTKFYWLDGAISIAILIVILIGTWQLLTNSLKMSLDAVPSHLVFEKIEKIITEFSGVENLHHLHIWAISTTENALTAHVRLNAALSFEEKIKLIQEIKHELQHNNINHATIELESIELPCKDEHC